MLALNKKPYDPGARPPSDRKPSGDKKQGIAPTVFYRIREHGVRLGADPRLATVLGRMGLFKELSEAEVDAGFRIAEIYGRYESLKGIPRRSAASPSYERGFGSKATSVEDMDPDEVKRHKKAVKRATKAFDGLMLTLGEQERTLVERVCCEDQEPGPVNKRLLAAVLHSAAARMGLIQEAKVKARSVTTQPDDGMLMAQAAVDALVNWFFDRASKPTHFSLVTNTDWKKSRGITGSDGRYHHTIPVPIRHLTAVQMDAQLRLACAVAGLIEIADAETGEVA